MKKNLSYFLAFIAIILISSQTLADYTDNVYCEVDNRYSNTNLLTSVNELYKYPLSTYFKGYNLEYEIEFPLGEPSVVPLSISPGIEKRSQETENDDYKIIIGQDSIIKSSGDGHFAILGEDIEGDYLVRFGSGVKTSTPVILENIKIPAAAGVECYGVTLLTDTIALVDCVRFQGAVHPPVKNLYYVVSRNGDHKEEYKELNDCWLYQDPFGRKTIKYITENAGYTQYFLIQGIPFDLDQGEPTEGYLNIFRYIFESTEEMHNGHLEVNAPITAESMGFYSTLNIAAFDTLGDFIYVLDHTQGVAFFQYKANRITNLSHHLNQSKDFANRWGISMNYAGSVIQMLVAESNTLKEYHLYHLDDDPEYIGNYKIENTLIGTVEMQSNADYIILQQGRLLTIYDRFEQNYNYIKGQIQNAELFYLWYSNNVYVYHQNLVTNYLLQDPTLDVSPHVEENNIAIKIKATSRNFNAETSCEINLTSVTISPANSRSAYETNHPKDIEWSYQKTTHAEIPLETFYQGPNMQYEVQILQENEDPEDEDHHIIIYNEPKLATVKISDDKEWKQTLIIPSFADDSIYTIHQDTNFDLVLYKCTQGLIQTFSLNCKEQIGKIAFGQPIQAMTVGTWGRDIDILAVVGQDIPSMVYFYTLLPIDTMKPGDLMSEIDFNDIKDWGSGNQVKDIVLHENSLYTIIESKSSRFVGISSYVKDIQHRNTITEADMASWPQIKGSVDNWNPQKIHVSVSHENVIFVQNQKEVFIISTETHTAMFLDYIVLATSINTEVFVSPHSLIVAQADDDIIDYSLQNLNWVSLREEFKYETYDYEFTDQFVIGHGDYSGLVYVMAYQKGTKNLKCLIYRSGVQNIRTLYKVIDIADDVTIDSTKRFSIDVGGQHVDWVFIQYNGEKKYIKAPVEPNVTLIPLVGNANKYVDYVKMSFTVDAFDGVTHPTVYHDLSLVNSQTTIILDYVELELALGQTLYANNQDHATFKADVRNWYEGSATRMEIQCSPDPEACGRDITLQNIVYPNPTLKEEQEMDVIDIVDVYQELYILETDPQHDEDYIIKVMDNSLDDSKTEVFAKIAGDRFIDCFYMTPGFDEENNFTFMILICYNYELEIYGTRVVYDERNRRNTDGEDEPTDDDFHYMVHVTNVLRGQYEYFHNELFINNQSDDTYNGIHIYDLTKTVNIQIHQTDIKANMLVNYVRSKNFEGAAPDLYITSFYVTYETLGLVRDEQRFVKLFITDSKPGQAYEPIIWFVSLDINNSYSMDFKYVSRMEWRAFIERERQFVNEDTNLIKFDNLFIEELHQDGRDRVIYRAVVMPDNTAIYEIDLYFSISDSDVTDPLEFEYTKCKVVNIYNNYGVAVPYPEMHFYGNAMAVGYWNTVTKEVTIALYELINIIGNPDGSRSPMPKSHKNYKSSPNADVVPLHTLQGGQVMSSDFGRLGMYMPPLAYTLYFNTEVGSAALISTDMSFFSKLQASNYEPNTVILETNGKGWDEQEVEFILVSDYAVSGNKFSAKVAPGSFTPVNPGGGGGVSGWVIALCVILGLALLGGAGFWFYKKKMANNGGYNRPLLKETQSEAGFSLQEPTKA